MISQISSHEFSGTFWETPSGEKQHNYIKVEKAHGEKVYAAAQRGCVEEGGGYLARDRFS